MGQIAIACSFVPMDKVAPYSKCILPNHGEDREVKSTTYEEKPAFPNEQVQT